ncbi:MAG: PAS domain S-box protein [Anaerolineae bacterium]|nr:PAS domain S-box protein [Anaerolineae bacterium]NUQ07051.1 PAS domain S-box protein [Anaerolineae bacterium]
MARQLTVLLVEEDSADAALVIHALEQEGIAITARCVSDAAAFQQALDEGLPDVVFSERALADFDAVGALAILRARRLDTPLFVITRAVDESAAADLMRMGAADFLLKDRLQRLAPAVERELRAAVMRTAHHEARTELNIKTHALDATSLGVMISDARLPDMPVVYVNPAFTEMTGYAADEILGQNPRLLQGGAFDQPALDEIRAALSEGRECRVLLHNFRNNREGFWNHLHIAPILDRSGQLTHFIGIADDVTAQITAEQELRALYNATSMLFRSQKLLDLCQMISDTVVREFNYVDCGIMLLNDERTRLMRLPRSGAYGIAPTNDLFVNGPGLVPTAVRTRQTVYAPDVSLNANYTIGSPLTQSELVIPLQTANRVIGVMDLQSKDIDAFSERDRRILTAYAEHASAAMEISMLVDEVNRYAASLEWRVAQRTVELQHAKDQVEAILTNTGDGIVLLDASGIIVKINPAFERLTGFPADRVLGQRFAADGFFWEPHLAFEQFTQVLTMGEHRRQELKTRRADGSAMDVDLVFALVPADESEARMVVCSLRDVTLQKQLEANLRESLDQAKALTDMRAKFISMVSHEFRTPLAVIQTSAELLHAYADRLNPEQRMDKLENIRMQVRHLTQIADGVVMMGRSDTVGMRYSPQKVDVIAFCRGISESLQTFAHPAHEIIFAAQGCEDAVEADENLLTHILHNLLSNAIKYSPGGGEIRVELNCQRNHLHLAVSDQGIGIPERDRHRLFEMFHRAGNVGSIGGTGLGLAVVKHAVSTYGGRISFTSQEGRGTRFNVWLPVTQSGNRQESVIDS